MPLSDNDVHIILLCISSITLVIVSLILIALYSKEDYSDYGSIQDMGDDFKDKNVKKSYTFDVQDPRRQQIVLKATIHPDTILRSQIENNYGQLGRLKILMEEELFRLDPTKEFHIQEIKLRPTVDGNNFVVYGKQYPVYTYALLHLKRADNNTEALLPVSGFGAGSEELIFSTVRDQISDPSSPIRKLL